MDIMLLTLLWYAVSSALSYYYFCRVSGTMVRWYSMTMYTALSCGFAAFQYWHWVGEFLYVLPGVLLLAICGMILQKRRFMEAFALSALIISAQSVLGGAVQDLIFLAVSNIRSETLFTMADFTQNIVRVTLQVFTFRLMVKSFSEGVGNARDSALILLLIPVLLITFVGAFISDAIYGNTIILDTAQGVVFPKVNSLELLIIRLLSCGGLFSTLFAYKRLTRALQDEKTIELLAGQAKNQEIYIKEAKERYEQTRSFRHDIKNHLLVIRGLLLAEKSGEAQEYLNKLEEVSDDLSFHVQTGNSAVDALLGSKLARGKGIRVQCALRIPQESGVGDLDWCVVLSNALDNALNAIEYVPAPDRVIYISGSQKGNIYLLNIANRCAPATEMPKAGLGLSNIKAVIEKYDGKMDIEIEEGMFKLSALLVIPRQLDGFSQQTP